ncbi:MAG: cytochrome O ubiquinol oxidase, partial [Weissella confusa]
LMLEVIAATIWVVVAVEAGYYFGGIPFVSEHFSLVIIGILVVTALPAIISAVRQSIISKKQKQMNQ